jgi:hypothetical protein
MNNNIIVEFPQGAGGTFLSTVLHCCIKNVPWDTNANKINFHTSADKVQNNHWFAPANNVISIDDPSARFNFWIYYFRKRVAHELISYRYQHHKWVKCPYDNLDSRGDAFWLLNQCRFIIQYKTQQRWKISWSQMLANPEASWKILQDFLDANNQPNYWNLEKWTLAVNDYRRTLSLKVYINTHHVRWQIWAIAFLQEQQITPEFDLVDNFRNLTFLNWLDSHTQPVIEATQKLIWQPG